MHIAVTYNEQSGQAKVFINGNLNKQGPASGRLSEDWDSYAAFGKHEGTVTDVDTLDEIYMYNRELTPFEVKTLYDNCNFGLAKTRELLSTKAVISFLSNCLQNIFFFHVDHQLIWINNNSAILSSTIKIHKSIYF